MLMALLATAGYDGTGGLCSCPGLGTGAGAMCR